MTLAALELARPPRDTEPRLTDYNQAWESFKLDVPERFNPVHDIVDRWASEDPQAPALLSLDGRGDVVQMDTVADLARRSRQAARALLNLGIGKGDHVFVMLPAGPPWYDALLGCMRIGAVPMPGPNLLTAKDIAYRLERAGARAVITDQAGAVKVDAAAQDLAVKLCVGTGPQGWLDWDERCSAAGDGPTPDDPTHRDDPLLLYFTSGTTSYPKMVQHRQSYGLAHLGTARFWQDLRPGDLHWTVSDPGWAKAAFGGLFGQFHERTCVVQVALSKPDPSVIFGILARYGITSFCAPPTLYRMLVQHDVAAYDLSLLRHCTSAGEPLNPEVIRAWSKMTGGLTIYEGYGQTETTILVANFRAVEVRPGSMGKAFPGCDVAIVHDDGQLLPAGEVGHVAVRHCPDRPLGLFPGYHGDEAATAAVFRGHWYFTGDKASVDEEGYFWFEGRGDDVITSAAYRIGPFEVESALIEHPAVVEAAVVGRRDAERTEIVVAFCVLGEGYNPSPELVMALQEHVKHTTAPYKYPRQVYFVDDLPKTVSGKIRRTEVRDWLEQGRY